MPGLANDLFDRGSILGALKDVIPDKVPADSCGELLALMFGGRHPDGAAFVTGDHVMGK